MRDWKTSRIIAIIAGAGVLLVLGCGLTGLGVQQRVISPANFKIELGPLVVSGHGPYTFVCPQKADPTLSLCGPFSGARGRTFYRVWLFWYTPWRRGDTMRILGVWVVPLRD